MSDSMFLALAGALVAALFVTLILGFVRPKPPAPAGNIAYRSTPFISNLAHDLTEAGIALSPQRYIGYSVVLGLVVGLGIELVFHLEILALAIGLGLGVFGLRIFYVSRLATSRRRTQMNHIIIASREIASLIHAGNGPDLALELYSDQATSRGVETLTRERNQIAEAIASALQMRGTKGLDLAEALRESADRLGNRYYRGMVEVYIRNERLDKAQVEKSLLFYAEGVNHVLALRRSLANVMGLPLASYKGMGLLCPALAIYMIINLQMAADFWLSYAGQLTAIGLFGYWSIGYWIQRRPLNERD
jgi:hypothetical protein